MIGLILGLILGFLIGGVISETSYNSDYKGVLCVIWIVFILLGGFAGFYIEKQSNSKYVESYIATKQTIEVSLSSEVLTGLERVQLVEQAVTANAELASEKYTASKWYGFACDKRVLGLEPINLG